MGDGDGESGSATEVGPTDVEGDWPNTPPITNTTINAITLALVLHAMLLCCCTLNV